MHKLWITIKDALAPSRTVTRKELFVWLVVIWGVNQLAALCSLC